jgi:hypothetical protein
VTEETKNALQPVISELKTLSPDITNAFVFKSDGETLACNEKTTPDQTSSLISNLKAITHAQCIGGIEHFMIQDVNTQLSLTAVGDVYFGTVYSRTANQKIVKSLTKVVVPAFIQLTLGTPAQLLELPKSATEEEQDVDENAQATLPVEEPEVPTIEIMPKVAPETATETEDALEVEETSAVEEESESAEPLLPTASPTQFMVERIGGLLIASDTVRIDSETIKKWRDLYDGKPFSRVQIETLEGKTIVCKFKPLGSQANAKGIIQIPGKIIQDLGTDRGKLVMVKPATN